MSAEGGHGGSIERGARGIALEILYKVDRESAFADSLLDRVFDKNDLLPLDRAFIKELVYGVLRQRGFLDWVIEQHSKRSINRTRPWIRNILRMGSYQLLFLTKVPVSAAINESVKLAKRYGRIHSASFANAVLREIDRRRGDLKYPEVSENPTKALAVCYSHPEWMVKRWLNRYGIEGTAVLCQANNKKPPLTIRTNTLKVKRGELSDALIKEGVAVEMGEVAPTALKIESPIPIKELTSFKEGWFYVQDEGAQLISSILSPAPGERVLDACAAPGGKCTHIAELMENSGEIVALDIGRDRLKLVNENAKRLGIDIIKTYKADASENLTRHLFARRKFHKIVVDAPCSGLGILRRHPEGKWRKEEKIIYEYRNLQINILEAVSGLLSPGGILLYSTCSTEPEENEDVMEEFIKRHPEFRVNNPEPYLSHKARDFIDKAGYFRTLLNQYGMDGFFAARLIRI